MVQVWLFVGLQKVLKVGSMSPELFFKYQLQLSSGFHTYPYKASMLMIIPLNLISGPKSTELHYDHLTEKLSLKDHPLPLLIFKQKQVYTNTSIQIPKSLNKLITRCVQCYLEEL